jgi:hypothetical protein
MKKHVVTEEMQYWGWVLGLIATVITILWIGYNASKTVFKRKN